MNKKILQLMLMLLLLPLAAMAFMSTSMQYNNTLYEVVFQNLNISGTTNSSLLLSNVTLYRNIDGVNDMIAAKAINDTQANWSFVLAVQKCGLHNYTAITKDIINQNSSTSLVINLTQCQAANSNKLQYSQVLPDIFLENAWSYPERAATTNGLFAVTYISIDGGLTSGGLNTINYTFAIPNNATIKGVKLFVNRMGQRYGDEVNGRATDYMLALITNSSYAPQNISNNATNPLNWSLNVFENVSYGNASSLYGINLSVDVVNSKHFGVVLDVAANGINDVEPDNGVSAYYDEVKLAVFYNTNDSTIYTATINESMGSGMNETNFTMPSGKVGKINFSMEASNASISSCPANVYDLLLRGFIIVVGLFIAIYAQFKIKHSNSFRLISFIGSVIVIVGGLLFTPCMAIVGIVIALLGIVGAILSFL